MGVLALIPFLALLAPTVGEAGSDKPTSLAETGREMQARVYAQQIFKKAPKGTKFQTEDGSWIVK